MPRLNRYTVTFNARIYDTITVEAVSEEAARKKVARSGARAVDFIEAHLRDHAEVPLGVRVVVKDVELQDGEGDEVEDAEDACAREMVRRMNVKPAHKR